jgi:hypothetical protein
MNKREQEYAIERINYLANQKLEAIKDALPVLKPKRITYTKAVALIKQGKILINPKFRNKELYSNDDFDNVFDVTKYHEERYNFTPYDEDKFKKKAAPIYAEVTRIKDQIMLGDATEALKMIEEFAKM